ncbi:MAG: PAS domain S-box protein [Bacteroidales bacterium]|nr:PAS domain S-box protein [Bacteroidales bacterium]
MNQNGEIEDINKKGCEILGYKKREILGKNWFDHCLPESIRTETKNSFFKLIQGKIKNLQYYENLVLTRNKQERLIAWNNTIIKDADGNITGTLSSGEDITERKQNQQKLFNAVIHAEEEERSRIAKDLHDGVSPVLSTLKLYVQSFVMSKDENLKETLISRISDTINETISSIKEISNNLSPHILHNFGYTIAVESFINRIKDIKKVNFHFEYDFDSRFDEKIEITLYRVTIELINNSLKHSNAGNIKIVFNKNSYFIVNYDDDGNGFDPEKAIGEKKVWVCSI